MRRKILISVITILTFVLNAQSQDTLVSAFFGLDNGLPSLLCNQPGSLLDGMPVNFKFPLDASSLLETDFEEKYRTSKQKMGSVDCVSSKAKAKKIATLY